MPPHDAHDSAGLHPDIAGWVLHALDHDDDLRFAAHLQDCEDCQTAVAELRPVAQALDHAAPALEPPADLGARTLVAVQQAAAAAGPRPAKAAAKRATWWRWPWSTPLLSAASALAGAAVAIAVVVAVLAQSGSGGGMPAQALTFHLTPPPRSGQTASATALARPDPSGSWDITLTVHHLTNFGDAKWYQCWYVSTDGQKVASAGTFLVPNSGTGTFSMTSAVDPHNFRRMEIRLQPPNSNGGFKNGTVVLSGTAQTL